jgi:hypothetical protein
MVEKYYCQGTQHSEISYYVNLKIKAESVNLGAEQKKKKWCETVLIRFVWQLVIGNLKICCGNGGVRTGNSVEC